jgi:hypothetical protein
VIKTLHRLVKDYRRNYRYHGGVSALARCLIGNWRLRGGWAPHPTAADSHVDCITCSVIPQLTALWVAFVERAINSGRPQVIIGDCSGGLGGRFPRSSSRVVLPLLNHEHGKKLDLLLRRVCRAEYVVVSDDDVFWLTEVPWQWALEQFRRSPKIAVVSLVPRDRISSVLQGQVERPMGSSCLILRREIWLRERLSFEISYPSPEEGFDWYYDTADLANVELLRRGYEVVTAPAEIKAHLAVFEAISAWLLKVQLYSAQQFVDTVARIPLQQEKAMGAILAAKGFAQLYREQWPALGQLHLVAPELLDRVEAHLRPLLDPSRLAEIQARVDGNLDQIRCTLRSFGPPQELQQTLDLSRPARQRGCPRPYA